VPRYRNSKAAALILIIFLCGDGPSLLARLSCFTLFVRASKVESHELKMGNNKANLPELLDASLTCPFE
jgi:hypothetical protein